MHKFLKVKITLYVNFVFSDKNHYFFEHNTGTGLWDQGAILVMIWKGCETIPTMLLLLGLN